MGLGLKDGILHTAAFHNKDTNELLLPNNHCHPGFITVLQLILTIIGLPKKTALYLAETI
jgi:hypothetical protein